MCVEAVQSPMDETLQPSEGVKKALEDARAHDAATGSTSADPVKEDGEYFYEIRVHLVSGRLLEPPTLTTLVATMARHDMKSIGLVNERNGDTVLVFRPDEYVDGAGHIN